MLCASGAKVFSAASRFIGSPSVRQQLEKATLMKITFLLTVSLILLTTLISCSYTVNEAMLFNERPLIPLTKQFHFSDTYFTVDDSVSLNGWMLTKDSAVATIFLLHGNSNNLYELPWIKIINALGNLNVNVFAIDYRGFGRSSGKVSFKGLYRDAQGALTYLKSTSYGSKPIIVYGLSMGSIPAVDVAQNPIVSGLILEGPISSSADALEAIKEQHWYLRLVSIEYPEDVTFDSIDKIKDVKSPVLIIHGDRDNLPEWMSQKLYNAINHSNRHFYAVQNGNHCDTYKVDTEKYFLTLSDFINQCIVLNQK
jgi:fermentation-respiration switch protein FrsA (DUF1100 family)